MKYSSVVGLLLCSLLAFSVYAGFVRFVGELFQHDFIAEVRITGNSQDGSDAKFKIGSVLNVTATLNDANTYLLDVYDKNDSLVYHTDGGVNGSQIMTEIPLLPPIFETGQAYKTVFTAGIFNYPLYGTCASSSLGSNFTVINSYTKLNFTVAYDTEKQQLNAASVLCSDSLKPLENMTVNLYLMPNVDLVKPDRGWILLDSTHTDANGRVFSSFALDMMGGQHALQARFTGDDNFGSCSKSQYFNVTFKPPNLKVVKVERQNTLVSVVLQLVDKYDFPLRGKLLSFEALKITDSLYAITDDTGCATLSFRLDNLVNVFDARFSVSGDDYISAYQAYGRLNASASEGFMISEWGETGSGSLRNLNDNAVSLRLADSSTIEAQARTLNSSWVDINLIPSPGDDAPRVDLHEDVEAAFTIADGPGLSCNLSYYLKDTGTQNETYKGSANASYCGHTPGNETESIYGGSLVWWPDSSGNFTFRVVAKDGANCTIAEGESEPFYVKRGNANLVAYLPSASDGNSTSLTVGFAKARTYNDTSNSYFATTRLAPIIQWNNTYYAVDQGTNSSWIDVYVNGTKICGMVPDGEGLFSTSLALNYSSPHFSLNVTAVSNQTSRYESGTMQQIINFTKVNVSEDPTQPANCSTCAFNYTLAVLDGERTYINLNNTVSAIAMVLDQPIFNVSASFTAFKVSSRIGFGNTTSFANVSACQYLLVKNASFPNNSTAFNVASDVNLDTRIDMKDLGFVASKIYETFPSVRYDYHADLNGDLKIDMYDMGVVASNFLKNVSYVQGSFDYRSIAVDFNVSGSLIRCFLDGRGFVEVPSGASRFNMSHWGIVDFLNSTWQSDICSNSIGEASPIWNPSVMGVYAFRVKLPSTLNLTVAMNTSQTQISGCLNRAGYYYVVKRSINYTVDSQSLFETEIIPACADTYVIEDDYSPHGGDTSLETGFYFGKERISYIDFNVSCIPSTAYIVSARLNIYEYYTCGYSNASLEIRRINGTWSEYLTTWSSRPSVEIAASCNFTDTQNSRGWRLLDVTESVRGWHDQPSSYHGFAIVDANSSDQRETYFCSRQYSDPLRSPALEVSYLDPSPKFCVSSYDRAVQAPVSSMSVKVFANGNLTATGTTNSSGMFDFSSWRPSAGIVYNMSVGSEANDIYAVSNGSSVYDYRWPTVLSPIGGNSTSALALEPITFNFSLSSSGLFSLRGMPVIFYVNGTFTNGTSYSCAGNATTSWDGRAGFNWTAPHTGTYSVKAFFEGNTSNVPTETYISVSVETIPLAVLFTVSPAEFEVGDQLTLNATIINPSTNQRFGQTVEVQFMDYCSDGSNSTLDNPVNSTDGVALKNVTYPNDTKVRAYTANITRCIGESAAVQTVASSPVQLTVGHPTRLDSWIESGYSQTERYVAGYLTFSPYNWLANGLGNRQITMRINQTEFNMTTSNESWSRGYFSYERDFLPDGNESVLYTITASFNGEAPVNSTVWAKTLDGQDYVVCTTSQYEYRPCYNTTCLTVEPISSITSILVKTPEGMQKEAESSGWFRVDPEFSWWYPWFRLHYKLNVDLPQGNPKLDYGWSPLPFGESSDANTTTLANVMNDATEGNTPEQLAIFFGVIAVPLIIQATTCHYLGTTPFAIGIAVIAYLAFIGAFTVWTCATSDGSPRAWLMTFMSTAFVEMATLFIPLSGVVGFSHLLTTGSRLVLEKIRHPLQALHASKMGFLAITGAIFALIDFVVMVFYLRMYLNSILA